MALPTRQAGSHTVVDLDGDLRIAGFVDFKNQIEGIIHSGVKKLAINLGNTKSIDSSNLRLLINVKKMLTSKGGDLGLLNPTNSAKEILKSTNLNKVFTIYENESELGGSAPGTAKAFDYWDHTEPDDAPVKRVTLHCAVCGSDHVFGYVLSPNHRTRIWVGNSFLPSFQGLPGGRDASFERCRVAVCAECFFASIDLEDFNLMSKDSVVRKSKLDSEAKALLTKGISKRKKFLDVGVAIGDNFFEKPRTDASVLVSYRLANECARTASLDRDQADAFKLAYLSILEGEVASSKEEVTSFDRARTWISEMFKTRQRYSIEMLLEAHYYRFISCLRLDRKKDAQQSLEEFERYAQKVADKVPQIAIDFWLIRAREIWEQFIKSESEAFKI